MRLTFKQLAFKTQSNGNMQSTANSGQLQSWRVRTLSISHLFLWQTPLSEHPLASSAEPAAHGPNPLPISHDEMTVPCSNVHHGGKPHHLHSQIMALFRSPSQNGPMYTMNCRQSIDYRRTLGHYIGIVVKPTLHYIPQPCQTHFVVVP